MSDLTPLIVPLQRLPHSDGLPLPAFATAGAAGLDVFAAVDENGPIVLEPMKRALVPTGLSVAVPPGYEMQVRPRSGLAWKNGLTVLNGPGTVDADYRGEVKVMLIHLGEAPFTINRGDKIAQLVIARYAPVVWEEMAKLPSTERGAGGFGSTGV